MLDLLHEIENEREDGWEAASLAELQKAEETRRLVVRVGRAFLIVVLILLVFSSDRLMNWVNGFEVGPVQNGIVALAGTWSEQMSRNGFNEPASHVRDGMTELRGTGWPEVKSRFDSERARTSEGAKLLRGMLSDRQG